MQTELERLSRGDVVRAGVGRTVGGFKPVDLAHHTRSVRVDDRAFAEQLVRFVGQVFGILLIGVAHGDQVEVHVWCVRQLGQPGEVAPPHPAAADDGQSNRIIHALRV